MGGATTTDVPPPPAWTRVASTAFTASRGGLAPSTLALLNYNGLDSRATPLEVVKKAANGNPSAGAPARKICGGHASKILVSHTGGAVAKTKQRVDDYGPTKNVPVTGPVLTHGAPGIRMLTHLEKGHSGQVMGGSIGLYPSYVQKCSCGSNHHGGGATPAPMPCVMPMPCPMPMMMPYPYPYAPCPMPMRMPVPSTGYYAAPTQVQQHYPMAPATAPAVAPVGQ